MTQCRRRFGNAFASRRSARWALLGLLIGVATGCTTTVYPASAVCRYEPLRAREMGPADYAYAEAQENALRADLVTRIRGDVEAGIARNHAIIAHLAARSAAIRRDARLSAIERHVQEAAYSAQVRTLQDRLLRQSEVASGLRTQEGILMQRCRSEQERGRALEGGRLPSATY